MVSALARSLALALLLSGCAELGPAQDPDVSIQSSHSGGNVVAFNHSATLLASGGWGGGVRLWSTRDGSIRGGWQAHTDSVNGIVFLEDGAQVLSAGYDRKLARWKADGELLRGVETPSPITHMVAHEGNARAVTGHDDGSVRVWHLPELELAAEYYRVHQGAVRAVALHAPSGQIASSGRDGRVYLLRPNAQPLELPRPPTDAWSLAFPPDGARLTGGGWFKLFDWDLGSAKLRVLNTAHGGIINGLHYSRDGTYVASISRQLDSSIYFLDPLTGEALQRFRPHELCGGDIRLSPEDAYLATTSDDANVRIWDLRRAARAGHPVIRSGSGGKID